MTQEKRNEQWDELEAFFAYIEDPDSDLTVILAVEEMHEVKL
ncbi:hypothetical protein OTB74_05055 [Streptomyces sp. H34-S4]|nr:hypothetical protein [Streptomyces sp. H34-S4]MCY0933607.1 hypothetical protein [Streptomyces sp. H34-S4]